ncbi:unnamed protein product [Cylicocyclus nassatus]|uniref:RNA-directed DNA polymerase n=1 Tax=Cylicocyclus nassatus TaxID=53992 RepID=A0AA36MEE1_CYLNA|nr:unnamed protein product [Cylicocyclus nassatus]
MVSALRFFKATIYGHLTRIFSDHRPLTYLLKHNKTHDNLARWVVELQSYNITIEYLKGSSNVVADCLSRSVNPQTQFQDNTPESEDIVEFPMCLAVQGYRLRSLQPTNSSLVTPIAIKPYDALLEQKRDPVCSPIMSFLETGQFPDNASETDKAQWLRLAEDCHLRANGCLYHLTKSPHRPDAIIEQLFLPEKLREPVFHAMHTSATAGGHFNWRKTLAKIARKYFWPHMSEQIFALSKACDSCQRKRAQAFNREKLLPVVTTTVFDKVYMDLTGPLHTSESGNKYVLALLDHFSKYVITAPLPDCSAVTVAHAIMTECILKFGVMTQLISDNASYFKGELISEIGRLLRIGRYFTTPYHHEGNGAYANDPGPGQPANPSASPAGPSPVTSSSGLPGEAMEGDSTVTPTPAAGMEQLTAPTHVPLTSEPREMEALMSTSSTSADCESSSTSDLGVPAREEHDSEWLWLEDRLDQFDSYIRDPRAAKKRMAHLFRVACSALAAAESSSEEP